MQQQEIDGKKLNKKIIRQINRRERKLNRITKNNHKLNEKQQQIDIDIKSKLQFYYRNRKKSDKQVFFIRSGMRIIDQVHDPDELQVLKQKYKAISSEMNEDMLINFLNTQKPSKYDDEICRLLKINQKPDTNDADDLEFIKFMENQITRPDALKKMIDINFEVKSRLLKDNHDQKISEIKDLRVIQNTGVLKILDDLQDKDQQQKKTRPISPIIKIEQSQIKIKLPEINVYIHPQKKIPAYDCINIDNILNSKPFKSIQSTQKQLFQNSSESFHDKIKQIMPEIQQQQDQVIVVEQGDQDNIKIIDQQKKEKIDILLQNQKYKKKNLNINQENYEKKYDDIPEQFLGNYRKDINLCNLLEYKEWRNNF